MSAQRLPAAGGPDIRIEIRSLCDGVDCVVWRAEDDRPDTFVLAHQGTATDHWLTLADVIVRSPEQTRQAAHDCGVATLRELDGSTLVAVGIQGCGCLLRCRDGSELVLPTGDGSMVDTYRCAVTGYPRLVLAGSLAGLIPLGRGPVCR